MDKRDTPQFSADIVPSKKVVVVGAGIIGMTSAIQLQNAGYDVEIWTKGKPGAGVTRMASFWEPYGLTLNPKENNPLDKPKKWGKDTLDALLRQIREGVAGLGVTDDLTVFPGERDKPYWADDSFTFLHNPAQVRSMLSPEELSCRLVFSRDIMFSIRLLICQYI